MGIRDILSRSLKQVDVDAEVSTDWAGLCWTLAVGKEIAAVSRVNKVAPKTLYVEVAGKEWVSALEALKKKLIGKVQQQSGFEAITKIIFKEAPASNFEGIHPRVSVKNKVHSNSNPSAPEGIKKARAKENLK